MKKQTKLILLSLSFIIAAALYFAAVRYEFEPITPIYAVLATFSGVGFFLVNGGVRPTVKIEGDDPHTQLSKKQKSRLRYRKSEAVTVPRELDAPRANIFRLSPEKQKFLAEILLIAFIVPTAILVIDYLLIAFIPSYI